MVAEQLGNRRGHQPIDLGIRVAPAQFVERRNGVHDVSNRRKLYQQDSAEFAGTELFGSHAHAGTYANRRVVEAGFEPAPAKDAAPA